MAKKRCYKEELDLKIKDNYQVFKIQGKNSNGRPIDFVGKLFYRDKIKVRKRKALAFMQQSREIQKRQIRGRPISFKMACGFLSRASCIKHSNSKGLQEKYYDVIDIRQLKKIIRKHMKGVEDEIFKTTYRPDFSQADADISTA